MSLHSLLYWQDVLAWPDPLEQARTKEARTGRQELLCERHLATANVLTLRPRQDGDSGEGSARRLDLAMQFAAAGLHVLGLHETRCPWRTPRLSRQY